MHQFLRDAMLAQVLAVALCLSQVGVLSKWVNEWSWFLAWELPTSTYLTLCYKEIRVSSKIRVLPSGTLLQTLDLKFRHSISFVKTLSTKLNKSGRSKCDKLDRRRSTMLTIPASSDRRLLLYHTIKLCLQHDSVARVY